MNAINAHLINRIECALPRSGFKPVRMRFDFWCSVNAPYETELAIFNFARLAPKLRYYGDVVYSFYRKLAIEHDGCV